MSTDPLVPINLGGQVLRDTSQTSPPQDNLGTGRKALVVSLKTQKRKKAD